MKQLFLIVLIAGSFFSSFGVRSTVAQTAVPLTLSVRHADGTPAIGEAVTLTSQPDFTAQTAVTNEKGQVAFAANRGIYELAFSAPLDDISALAVAEGGLAGFGITVGDEAITYHFTLHEDGNIYFDDAPDADIPSPIMPTQEDLHFIGGAGEATPTPLMITLVEATALPVIEPAVSSVSADVSEEDDSKEAVVETAVSAHLITSGTKTPISRQDDSASVVAMTATATPPSPTGHPNRRPNWLVLGLPVTAGVVMGVVIYFISARPKR